MQLDYADASGQRSLRTVRPLGCFFWGSVWTLVAWCEARSDFRSFRIDRIAHWQALQGPQAPFQPAPGQTLADFLRQVAPAGTQARLTEGD